MATALSGHALQDMPTQSRGHGTRQFAMDEARGMAGALRFAEAP